MDTYRSATRRGHSLTLITILFSIRESGNTETIEVDDFAWIDPTPGPH
jgi:hypothetical protein